ncbi:class I SAM-dependent methyltransferase [Halovivax limisalsi]|uniref:class I SAM-dependent methyltransferase n=1 Tax=Halovivax limisalsi TaxID=1453760 RepID=UPI001FFCAF22|nr:class I SAM-dependent methyltransferase [Halovivax limisalsi]
MDRRREVRRTYERIGSHFAETRAYAWPEVEAFVEDIPRSLDDADARTDPIIGLDLGCGNCRHAEVLASHVDRVVGVDVSRSLLDAGRERARERSFADALDPLQADAARLPIGTDAVDCGLYVATLHHLPTMETRRASLDELARVLDAGGRALVSVWSTAHDRFDDRSEADTTGFDTTVEWTLPGGTVVDRFYHIYAPDEFERDLAASGLDVLAREMSSGNCYATVAGPDA